MANPTNADIMNLLVRMTGDFARIEEKVDRVEAQANKTNGRVTRTEEFINALKAVEKYKKENPTQVIQAPNAKTVTVQPQKWFQSKELVGAVAVIAAAAAAVLAAWGGTQ